MDNSVSFYLNGEPVTIENPSPTLLLIDFLRSSEVGLTGAKKGCGQGGCGACTVILSKWNNQTNEAEHRSINSCLRPVCALGGLAITTVEGTGGMGKPVHEHMQPLTPASRGVNRTQIKPSEEWKKRKNALLDHRDELVAKNIRAVNQLETTQQILVDNPYEEKTTPDGKEVWVKPHADEHEGMNPVAHRLAINNGTQCGYCSVGFVMNMSAFLADNPSPTKQEIEDIFDGNICRCTGYRSILTGMKTFAADWSKEDEENRMKCVTEDKCDEHLVNNNIRIPFPEGAKLPPQPVNVDDFEQIWVTPQSLSELKKVLRQNRDMDTHIVFSNTSFGIYPDEFMEADVLVDIKLIPELYGIDREGDWIVMGGGTTYSEFLDFLEDQNAQEAIAENSRWGILDFMARRTAGMIVRNAASVAGNTMLVLHHIFEGEPFPSDLFTAMDAISAEIEYLRVSTGRTSRVEARELVNSCRRNENYADDIVILRYFFPKGAAKNEYNLAQKTALREVNAHSIVNCGTRIEVDAKGIVTNAEIVFGGVAPYAWHARNAETWMKGKKLSTDMFPTLARIVDREVRKQIKRWEGRMELVPNEDFTEDYKAELAYGFIYKAVINALVARDKKSVPKNIRSSGEITWGKWGVSDGTQHYTNQEWKNPVSQPYIKLMAFYQASGQVHYTHEIELPPLGKNAAFIQSQVALGTYHYIDPSSGEEINAAQLKEILSEIFEGFYELITYQDIPKGGQNNQGMGSDQPIMAESEILYFGQVISVVIAESEQEAIQIAEFASQYCVGYGEIDWPEGWKRPILTIDEAIEKKSIFPDAPSTASFVNHIWKITRPGTDLSWVADKPPLDKTASTRDGMVDGAEVLVVENTQVSGDQVHFYMETQACVALPMDGNNLMIHPSSQSPMEMHQTAALSVGLPQNKVEVEVHQLGGGYGGKTEQAKFVTGPIAVAATALNLPVRIAMKREHDTQMIGKRHGYYGQYQIAVDKGETDETQKGIIRGLKVFLWGDGGAFYDCSFIVSNCIQLRIDNAYNIKNFESQLDVVRTNTAPNTAMRAFGDIQGKLILENAIDDAAYSIGMCPYKFREKNMYYRGDVTPFGQALSYCYMRDVWKYVKEISNYDKKLAEVKKFNDENKWTKQGVYIVPVKYGSGYNLVAIEQAAAVISVYAGDGTIMINQGGVDMGQGFMTKVEQVASYVLNVPMELIRIQNAKTSIIPNPTSTGGSTGTPYNGEAVKQAAQVLRQTLVEFGYRMLNEQGPEWCTSQGIDFWNYPMNGDNPNHKGWATSIENPTTGVQGLIWQNLVSVANQYRVPLIASFNAPITGGETPVPAMTFKQDQEPIPGIAIAKEKQISGIVDSFPGFTYSAACAHVEVDVITGETKILSADLVYDMGWSINPAIDIGQVEGAFMQGVGYVMLEKLVWQAAGQVNEGRLNTDNTWRYKPPATTSIPLKLNTYLYPRDNSAEVPESANELFSSKEVGEPPLVLASCVFFAIKAAIRASREDRDLSGLFKFDAPATVQEIRAALAVKPKDFKS